MEQPRTLADVVRLAYTRTGITASRRLEEYARKHGHALTHTTLNKIMAGTYPARPKEQTLRALAFLSGVPYNDVRVIAGLPSKMGRSLADQLPPDVDELEPRPRMVLIEMARVLLELQHRQDDQHNDSGISVASLRDLGLSSTSAALGVSADEG